MTFNIAHGRRLAIHQIFVPPFQIKKNLDKIGDFLQKTSPDIVGLQEVDQNAFWSGGFSHLKYLAQKSKFPYWKMGVNNQRKGWLYLFYGNGILSKYKIENFENVPFGHSTFGEKGFLYAEIRRGKQRLPVVVLHLDFRTPNNRLRQAKILCNYLNKRKNPQKPIIMGDFNCNQIQGDALNYILDKLKFSKNWVYPKKKFTFSTLWPRKSIDFLLIPPPFTLKWIKVLPVKLSDHFPVLAEISLPKT